MRRSCGCNESLPVINLFELFCLFMGGRDGGVGMGKWDKGEEGRKWV